MKLVVTADLHYDVTRSQQPTRDVAEQVCGLRADALLILGDVGGPDLGIVRECLSLFDRFKGVKLFVAGNHDLWARDGEDSLDRLERVLPEVCRETGFHPLDTAPALLGRVGFVGSIGWYDFGYRPARLGVPLRFYRAKIAPGAAARLGGHEDLLADPSDIPEAALKLGTRWMDGQRVRLPISDVEFCHRLVRRFSDHLASTAPNVDAVVVGMHHVPFWQLVPHNDRPNWAFAGAFMGSELFGEVMLGEPKVRYAFVGHTHRHLRRRCGHIECVDVGCTYQEKRYELIEL